MFFMSRRWLILFAILGLSAFFMSLLANLPASLAGRWLLDRFLPGVTLEGVSGTIWEGQALQLQYRDFQVDAVGWRIIPGELLAGRFKGAFFFGNSDRLGGRGGLAAADAANFRLDGIQAWFALADVAALAGEIPGVKGGAMRLDLAEAAMVNGELTVLKATLELADLALAPPWNLEVGAFRLEAGPSPGGLRLHIRDVRSPFYVDAILQLWIQQGRFRIKGWMAAREDPDGQLTNQMRTLLGPPQKGRFPIDYAGFIPGLGGPPP
ncbi:MAG: type II secretion system protein N [Magnetococcales bacterium]|nr:type II secretion system protein N [Magnetococcales bacterium]